MNPADAEALGAILRPETSTPESCWFCVWEGFGWVDSVVAPAVWNGARVRLPERSYLLYGGPVEAAVLTSEGRPYPVTQSASLWWPSDRSWCIATEIDLPWTYVGGAGRLIERVLHDPRLEALPAAPDDPLTRIEPWARQWAEDAASEIIRRGKAIIVTPAGSVEAWLEPPRSGGKRELRYRISALSRGSMVLGRREDEDQFAVIVSTLTWQVTEELTGL